MSTSGSAPAVKTESDSPLDFLRRRNAELEGVAPSEMTLALIRESRAGELGDHAVFNRDGSLGGHNSRALRFLTRRERAALAKKADKFFSTVRIRSQKDR